jgi:hypothetical protein
MKEARKWTDLANMDAFFFYEDLPLDHSTEHDVAVGVMQPKRTLYYDREDSAGISEYENLPSGIYTEIVVKYDIASWVSRRNQFVGNGEDGTADRRIATSQSVITVERRGGEIDVNIVFASFADIQTPTRLTAPLGGGLQ